MEPLPLVPLRPEVEIPRHRWSAPHSPLVIAIALLSLSWLSALAATAVRPVPPHRAAAPTPAEVHRMRRCRDRMTRLEPAPTPVEVSEPVTP